MIHLRILTEKQRLQENSAIRRTYEHQSIRIKTNISWN